MVRILGTVVIRLVAAITRGGKCGVVVVDVALCAWHVHMRSRQRERRRAVIETGLRPGGRGMARLAGRREPNRSVIWIIRAGIVRFMTGVTVRWHGRVVVIHVALRARNRRVRPRQRECAR